MDLMTQSESGSDTSRSSGSQLVRTRAYLSGHLERLDLYKGAMGMDGTTSEQRRRVLVVVLSIVTVALLAGASAASISIRNSRANQAQAQQESEEEGVHGGPVERHHGSGCDLVDTSSFEGNWTHGDYVNAVAEADPSKASEAARSRCGKPVHAGQGGPGNARAEEAKAKAKAAKEARDAERTE